jgi:hypothetical protein
MPMVSAAEEGECRAAQAERNGVGGAGGDGRVGEGGDQADEVARGQVAGQDDGDPPSKVVLGERCRRDR